MLTSYAVSYGDCMFGLNSIGIENISVLKSCNVTDLSDQGFVAIRGRNMDSQAIEGNSNACGKSLLFSTLPVVIFEAEPLAKAKNNKGTFLAKKGKLTLNWTAPNGKKIEIQQTTSKYKVFIDGQDQKVDRQDVAKGIIAENFPLSRDEFYSFAYLNSYLEHPFQRATKAERMKYITDVFKLDLYDRLKAVFLRRLNEAKDAESTATTQAAVLDGVNVKLAKLDFTDDEKKAHDKLQKKVDRLSQEEKGLQATARTLSVDLNVAKSARSLTSSLAELPKEVMAVTKIKREISNTLDWIDSLKRYAEYEEVLAEYIEQKKKREAKVAKLKAELKGETSIKAIQKAHTKLVEREEQLKADIDSYQEFLDSFWALSDDITKLASKFEKTTKPDISKKAIADLETYAKSFIRIYNKLHDHDGTECPTCGSEIDMKLMADQYKKAKKDLAECESATAYYEMRSELKSMREELKRMFKEREPDPKYIEKLEKELKSVTKKLDVLESQYSTLEEYAEAKARLDALREPKKVAKPKAGSVKKLKQFVDDLRTRQRLEDALAELKVPSKSYKAIRSELDDCESQLQKLRKKLNALAEESRDYKGRSTEFRVLNSQRKELEAKIKELQPLIDAKKVAECMCKAYSSNNLKVFAASRVLSKLQDQMNAYSHLVFPEPMHFELSADEKGVSALVTRLPQGDTSDVAALSGAETNCFRLLWALSILPFIPDSCRPNFMILDEPDNSCSPAVREHIIKEFLPVLRDVVPNIYWITPLDADMFEDATVWTVVKKDGASTLEIS